MARTTTTVTKCDRDGCRNYGEVGDEREAPEGWYLVVISAEDHKVGFAYNRATGGFEFCSLECVGKWTKARRDFQAGKEPRPSRSSAPLADDQTEQIREAFRVGLSAVAESNPDAAFLSVADVVSLTGIEVSSVHRRVNALHESGELEQTHERRGPYPARYKLVEAV